MADNILKIVVTIMSVITGLALLALILPGYYSGMAVDWQLAWETYMPIIVLVLMVSLMVIAGWALIHYLRNSGFL